MPSFIDAALLEASDPTTSPERLRQLSNRKRRHERDRLRRAVAANPNADDDLLCGLASDYPREVVGNPRFQLLQLSGEAWGEQWDLHSLCSLTLTAGNDAPPYLQAAMKSRFEEIYDDYSEYVSIVRRETWCFARSVEILAGDGEGCAPFDIDLKIELKILAEGRDDSARLEINKNAASFSQGWVASMLQSLRNKDVESLFEVFCAWGESCDIDVDVVVDRSIRMSTTNTKIKIKD